MKVIGIIPLALMLVAVLATPKDDLNRGTRTFAATLYRELTKNKPNQNAMFSPFTLQTLMSLIASAAQNENAAVVQEIKTALSLPYSENDRRTAFTEVLRNLNRADNDFKVFDATKMYFHTGFIAQPQYQGIARSIYGADIEIINFKNPGTASQTINQWVATKTNNYIKNFVDYYTLATNTRELLINTLYVEGKWDKPFKTENNVIKTFHSSSGPQEVTMMTTFMTYDYYDDNDAQYLKLEMLREDGGAEMVFVLPRQEQGLGNLENNVQKLLQTVTFRPVKVHLTLPKFSFTSNMELKGVLENVGVRQIFRMGAQLKGLSSRGHPYVKFSNVLQKAYINVTEWGVTGAVVNDAIGKIDDLTEEHTFTADHPFLFYITVDDTMVYVGRVMQI